jgi:hypothetical protein
MQGIGKQREKPTATKDNGLRAKSNRGDRRCTFPNDLSCLRLLWLILPQPIDFAADTFFRLGNA